MILKNSNLAMELHFDKKPPLSIYARLLGAQP